MKRTIILVMLSVFSMAEIQADENDGLTTTSSSTGTPIIQTTFYGSKASSNPNNPCKGATIRVCGVIVHSFTDVSIGDTPLTLVKTTVKDAYGNVTSENQKIDKCTIAEAKEKFAKSGMKKITFVDTEASDD